jgi:hypothetical protein
VEAFQAETVRCPKRKVVEPNEPVDAEAGTAIVPRGAADEPAQQPAARILDAEDTGAVHGRAEHERASPDPVVERLEERLREPVDRQVEEAARATTPGVRPDE